LSVISYTRHFSTYPSVFSDQFAFRPCRSTTAALTTIFHTVTQLLVDNDGVIILALDFSKAFDTVRHHTLFEEFAGLSISDKIYIIGLLNSSRDIPTVLNMGMRFPPAKK